MAEAVYQENYGRYGRYTGVIQALDCGDRMNQSVRSPVGPKKAKAPTVNTLESVEQVGTRKRVAWIL